MNKHISQVQKLLRRLFEIICKIGLAFKQFMLEQFNKNIYTRVLFSNVICFVICLITVIIFFDFSVKQVTHSQIQQELFRKAKRVNFALLQQDHLESMILSENKGTNINVTQQEQLKFLSDLFDVKILVFDNKGNIVATSAKQEIVPGAQVDKKYIETITSGETISEKKINQETEELEFIAAIPMGDSKDTIVNGILLEVKKSNIDLNRIRMRSYLILGGIFLLLFIIVASVYQAIHISRPISRLTTSIAELNSGNYVIHEDNSSLDEVKVLINQFNKLAEAMQRMQKENQSVEEERTKLFAEISHELCTPLTAIQGFVEAIQDGVVEDQDLLEKYLKIIYTQTIHINRLVDDMLQLSRLETGCISLNKLPFNLISLVEKVVESMEAMAQSVGSTIIFEEGIDQAMIMGDIDRIEQVIKNLLQNAINATANGEIKVKVKVSGGDVILSIKDNGTGISNEDLPHIWDRFYRNKSQKSNNKQQGSGLGLVIVKQLVQLHNGKIDVESQLGVGTTFYVCFPVF